MQFLGARPTSAAEEILKGRAAKGDAAAFEALAEFEAAGRLTSVEEEARVYPPLRAVPVSEKNPGLQLVRVFELPGTPLDPKDLQRLDFADRISLEDPEGRSVFLLLQGELDLLKPGVELRLKAAEGQGAIGIMLPGGELEVRAIKPSMLLRVDRGELQNPGGQKKAPAGALPRSEAVSLLEHPTFRALPDSLLEEVLGMAQLESFQPSAEQPQRYWVRQADGNEDAFMVLEGKIKVFDLLRHIHYQAGPGETVGLRKLEFGNPGATMFSDSPVKLLRLPGEPFRALASRAPELKAALAGGGSSAVEQGIRDGVDAANLELKPFGINVELEKPGFRGPDRVHFDSAARGDLAEWIRDLAYTLNFYTELAASRGESRIYVVPEMFPDGSVQLTLSHRGKAIDPLSLDSFGSASQHLDTRAAKVIQGLRDRGFGPLMVRSHLQRGTDLRFVIPARGSEWLWEPNKVADDYGLGPPSRLERDLQDGFVVPAASMDLAVGLLREVPSDRAFLQNLSRSGAMLLSGSLRHRRLEILHRLLSGSGGTSGVWASDNGPGPLPNLALSLAKMGTQVVVRDLETAFDFARSQLAFHKAPPEVKRNLHPVTKIPELHLPRPSRIAYWVNPNLMRIEMPPETGLGEYLGRDVVPGGYLVVQTDWSFNDMLKSALKLDPRLWEQVLNARLTDYVFPTSQALGSSLGLELHIFRRR